MDQLVAWAFELAGEKLADVLPRRWTHVQGVGRCVCTVAPLFSVDDGELLIGAALLHDIGYAPEVVGTGFHPLDGARYVRSAGGPGRLVNLVAHHSCAAVEAEVRGLSSELAEFEDERTPALWWVDRPRRLTVGRRRWPAG
jgi:HD domain